MHELSAVCGLPEAGEYGDACAVGGGCHCNPRSGHAPRGRGMGSWQARALWFRGLGRDRADAMGVGGAWFFCACVLVGVSGIVDLPYCWDWDWGLSWLGARGVREGLFFGLWGVRGLVCACGFCMGWLFSCFGCSVIRFKFVQKGPVLVGCSSCRFAGL